MNLSFLDLAAVAFYFGLMAVVGVLTRRTKTFSEFAVGKHAVPAIMVFASLATTIVGPGFSIGFTGKSWGVGYVFYFLTLSYAVQVVLCGLYFAPRLSLERDCSSLGDVMRKRYGKFAQLLTGIVSVGLCVGFTAIMGKIGGAMLHAVSGWPMELCLIAVTGATALLTFTGGLRATVATEAIQFTFKCLIVPLMLFMALARSPDTLAALSTKASEMTEQAFSKMNGVQIFGIVLSFALGEVLLPPVANRALSAKSGSASRAGFLLAGGFVVAWLAVVATLGILAHGIVPAGTAGDDVFVTLGRSVLPAGVFGLLLAAMIAIIMSSQESVLNSSAVAFVRDIVQVYRPVSERATLRLAKVSTLCIAALAIFIAHYSPSIIDGLIMLYSIWAPTILVPLLVGLYVRRPRPLAGCLSILGGGGASLTWQLMKEPHGVPAIVVGLVVCSVCYAAGHALGRGHAVASLQPSQGLTP
jgi:SSS family solute:Na+ symporter